MAQYNKAAIYTDQYRHVEMNRGIFDKPDYIHLIIQNTHKTPHTFKYSIIIVYLQLLPATE